jgi:hypothetical protein
MPNDEKKNERKIIALKTHNFKIRLESLKNKTKKETRHCPVSTNIISIRCGSIGLQTHRCPLNKCRQISSCKHILR